jgi:5-formyltetrahydrofolate cyclo-ligase
MIPTKQQIRTEMAQRRKALSEDFKASSSAAIVGQLAQVPEFEKAKTLALYMYFGGEVRLDDLFPACWACDKRTCIPVYDEVTQLYNMAEITPQTVFTEGHYGIREPDSPSLIPMQDIDLMAIPGVAFDLKGNRLGRGGGFYDRMLSGFSGAKVAVAFDFQLVDEVPTEPHDLPVDILITEIKTLKI